MRTKKRSVLLRAPGLVVLLTLLLATTGLVYAHWTATLDLNGNVNTGDVVMAWHQAWTNDDGAANGTDVNDNGGPGSSTYDAWGGSSSADPSDHAAPAARYTKDVAKCVADINTNGDSLTWTIDNAYPSYYCTLTATISNDGSVPVRATSIAFNATRASDGGSPAYIPVVPKTGIESGFWLGTTHHQIEGDITEGIRCGTQIDPGLPLTETSGWLHVLEPALQNATYAFTLSQDFVNWNEWDVGMCTPGVPVANADGTLTGLFACPTAPEGVIADFNDCALP